MAAVTGSSPQAPANAGASETMRPESSGLGNLGDGGTCPVHGLGSGSGPLAESGPDKRTWKWKGPAGT